MSDSLISTSRMAQNDNIPSDLPSYEAFSLGNKRQRKLILFSAQGQIIGMPSYTHWGDAYAPAPDHFWLIFNTGAFLIEGNNLSGDILFYLQEDRIRYLQCYHQNFFTMPDESAPLIKRIFRHSFQEFMKKSANHER